MRHHQDIIVQTIKNKTSETYNLALREFLVTKQMHYPPIKRRRGKWCVELIVIYHVTVIHECIKV
jgi:hypothetical protein